MKELWQALSKELSDIGKELVSLFKDIRSWNE